MESRYIKMCRRLMRLKYWQLVDIYKRQGFAYYGGSNRRKLRMAARIVVYKYGKNYAMMRNKQIAYKAIDKYLKGGL